MKRFLVFTGDTYYPIGGWSDFKSDFDDIDEARTFAQASTYDWVQIVDTTTREEVNIGKRFDNGLDEMVDEESGT